MKRVLAVVVVVCVGIFVCGCKIEAEEPAELIVPMPIVTDSSEAITPDTSRGLVGWWKFDEVAGRTAVDSSRRGRNGTLTGDLSFDEDSVDGRIGRGLKFRDDNYVEIVGYKGIVGTQARTVAAWIKTKESGGRIMSWGKEEGGGMFNFGFVRGRVGVTPKGGYLYMNARVHDDAWHHVAAVVVEAELPNLHDHVKIYKDGEVAEIHDIGLLDLWPIDTASDLDVRIGKGFRGVIDEVRLYDRPLSEEEIRLLFRGK